MEKAWLITNAYLSSDRFTALYGRLCAEAKAHGIELLRYTNEDVLLSRTVGDPLFVLFWDKDVRAAELLQNAGYTIINSADAIALCDDKTKTYTALAAAGIPLPDTLLCPLSFAGIEDAAPLARDIARRLSLPLVVKEGCGSFGREVYLAKSEAELCSLIERLSPRPLLFSRYVEKSAGRDIRIYVVGGRVVASMLRENAGDFRSNFTGGTARPYAPSPEQQRLATDACAALRLDFGGVDIFDTQPPLLCEVNSNAHFLKIEKCTGTNVADAIISYALSRAAADTEARSQ